MTSRKNVRKVGIALLAIASMALLGVVALAPAGASDSAALVLPTGKTTTVEAARLAEFVASHDASNDGGSQSLAPNTPGGGPVANNWYVCKYVGTPGDFETLQTGQNPIFVDENAIMNANGGIPVAIGQDFPDAHGHSKVVDGPYAPPGLGQGNEPDCPTTPPPPCPNGTTTITATETVTETVTSAPDGAVPATVIDASCTVTTTTTVTETTTVPPPPECPGGTVTETVTVTAPPVTETVTVTIPAQALSANEYTYTTEPPVVTCTVTQTTVTTPTETTTVTTTPPCEENCTTTGTTTTGTTTTGTTTTGTTTTGHRPPRVHRRRPSARQRWNQRPIRPLRRPQCRPAARHSRASRMSYRSARSP